MRRSLCSVFLLMTSLAAGQTVTNTVSAGPAAAKPAERLRDFEATYLQELRRIQVPLISQYAARLQQLALSAPLADRPAIRAEIERVQQLIAAGGVVDLQSTAVASAETTKPRTEESKFGRGAVLVLKPEQARGFAASADHAGVELNPAGVVWPISALPAGSYEVFVLYSCADVKAGGTVSISLGGETFERSIEITEATKPGRVRPLRLGRLKLASELKEGELEISLQPADMTGFYLQQITLATPRKE